MGKGGGSAPTQQTVTQTNLPEYARPYFENIMNRGQAQSYQQYVPYENERTAYFTPGQLQTQQEVMGMQDPTQLYDASNIAYNAAMQSMQAGQNYQPGQFGAQMGPAERVYSQGVYAPNIQAAQTGYNPQLQNILAAGPQQVSSRNIQAAQTGYNPQLQNILAAGPQQVSAGNIQAAQTTYDPRLQDILASGPERVSAGNIQAARTTYDPRLQDILASGPERVSAGNIQAAQTTYDPRLQDILASGPERVSAGNIQAAQTTYDPKLQDILAAGPQQVSSRDITAAKSTFRPELKDILAGGPERVSTDRLAAAKLEGPQEFTSETAERYMSPYMQNVVEAQKREAIRDAQKAQLGQNLAAAKQGLRGNANQAILAAERERGLRTQLGDIRTSPTTV
jgi:hypothetical protein